MEYLFATYPLGTIRFFRKVIVFGFVTGVIMFVPVMFFIEHSWGSYTLCDRVLRSYHLIRFTMWILQLPLRIFMMKKLNAAKRMQEREAVVNSLLDLIMTPAWKLNQAAGIVSYLFFAFALVFSVAGSHCSAGSAYLYRFLIVNLVVFVMHMACSCLWLRQIMSEDAWEAAMWRRGLDEKQLDAITQTIVMPDINYDQLREGGILAVDGVKFNSFECNICFGDYAAKESIRVLPCAHPFHKKCVDLWLTKKKQCPLCQCEIDQAYEKNKKLKQLHVPAPGNNDIVVGAVKVPQPKLAVEDGEALNNPSSSSSSSSISASAFSSVDADTDAASVAAATSSLLSGLRTRRGNNNSSSGNVYSTHSPLVQTDDAQTDSSNHSTASAATVSSDSSADSSNPPQLLTRKGVPVTRPAATTSSSSIENQATNDSNSTKPGATSATLLPASRQPYAKARMQALETWRNELDSWAEENDEEPLHDEDGELIPSNANSAAVPTRTTPDLSASSSSKADVDELVRQWQLEESELANNVNGNNSSRSQDDEKGEGEDEAGDEQ